MFIANFNPVAFNIWNLSVHWYALSYIFGFLLGYIYIRILMHFRLVTWEISKDDIENMLFYLIFGVLIGGRMGYIVFYKPSFFLDPIKIIQIWNGGMSFHGGVIGSIISLYIFCSKNKKYSFFMLTDIIATASPIGIGLGRLSNFINMELWGRPTDVSWSVIFSNDPLSLARHPSQLYEAFFEGLIIFIIILFLILYQKIDIKKSMISALFLILYGIFRFLLEYTREPDPYLGFIFGSLTMGMILSLFLVALGVFLIVMHKKQWKH